MAHIVMASFANPDKADAAITALESLGYAPKDLSVISKQNEGSAAKVVNDTAAGAVSGATTGTVVGGLAGLLAGAGV